MGLNVWTNSEFTVQRWKRKVCQHLLLVHRRFPRAGLSPHPPLPTPAANTQRGQPNITSNRAALQPPQTNYTKTSQSERNCLYQFHKGIAWEPFLFRPNYKVSFELQNKMVWKPVFNKQNKQTRKDKMQWAFTRGLLPATAEMASFTKSGVTWKTSYLSREAVSKLPPAPFTKQSGNK